MDYPAWLTPEVLYGLLGLGTIFCLVVPLFLLVDPTYSRIRGGMIRSRAALGLKGLHLSFYLIGIILWAGVLIVSFGGLSWLILKTLLLDFPIGKWKEWDFGFHIAQVAAMTTVMGAVIALPVSLSRREHSSRQTDATEQKLITEQINKAVEGLGAETKVDRIGRIVVYMMPKAVRYGAQSENEADKAFEQYRRKFENSIYSRSLGLRDIREDPDTGEDVEIYEFEIWTRTESRIQWLRKNFNLPTEARDPEHKEWQVFSETVPNLEVRIGAIYALERISQDSDRDHVRIMEILCAYIRETTLSEANNSSDGGYLAPQDTRADIQTALEVIGRRQQTKINLERQDKSRSEQGYRLDLRRADLRGYDLSKLNLSRARFNQAKLEGADLFKTNFDEADFRKAHFGVRTRMKETSIGGAAFPDTDLQWVKVSTDQIQKAFGDHSTKLSEKMRKAFGETGQPEHWLKEKAPWDKFDQEWRKWQRDVLKMNPDGSPITK